MASGGAGDNNVGAGGRDGESATGAGGSDTGAGGTGEGAGGDCVGTVGRDGGTEDTGSADARTDTRNPDGPRDGAPTTCSLSTPFGTPVLVPGVNGTTGNDGTARLSPDELTIYFYSDRSGSRDIFSATRASRSDPFGTPRAVPGVNTSAADQWPSVTADGLSMYIESTLNGPYQVFVSHRTTSAAEFPTPMLVANVNIGGTNGQTFILPDESALYFASKPGTGGTLDLFRAARGSNGQFDVPVQVSTINTAADEVGPVPTADELTFYFASGRTDSPAKGNLDIWRATRASRTASFNPPVSVEELNTSNEEVPDWLSPDLCRLYFTRNVSGNKIYLATRSM